MVGGNCVKQTPFLVQYILFHVLMLIELDIRVSLTKTKFACLC